MTRVYRGLQARWRLMDRPHRPASSGWRCRYELRKPSKRPPRRTSSRSESVASKYCQSAGGPRAKSGSSVDTLAQSLGTQDRDLSAALGNQSLLQEELEPLVDADSGSADEAGQIRLSETAGQRNACGQCLTIAFCQVQEHPGQSGWDVQERRVSHQPRVTPQPSTQHRQKPDRDTRLRVEVPQEIRTIEHKQLTRLHGRRVRGPRLTVQQPEYAEERAGAEDV